MPAGCAARGTASHGLHALAPHLPVERGHTGSGLLADVLVSKYVDGLPLYRLSGILAREGVEIERQTLADWVGRAAWWLWQLAEAIGRPAPAPRVPECRSKRLNIG